MNWRFLLLLLLLAMPVVAQNTPRPHDQQSLPAPTELRQDWRTRLSQIRSLIQMGSLGRAITMLDQLEKSGVPKHQALPLRIAIAEAAEKPDQVVELARNGLQDRPGAIRLLRPLALALMATDQPDSAQIVVSTYIARSPNKITAVRQMIQAWREAGHPDRGLSLCDSLREAQGHDVILRRARARCLLALGDVEAGVDEILAEVAQNPLNMPLVRADLLDGLSDEGAIDRAIHQIRENESHRVIVAVALLEVDLRLRVGDDQNAVRAVAPLLSNSGAVRDILKHVALHVREVPLVTDVKQQEASWRWLLEVLEELTSSEAVPVGQRLRVLDLLATVAESALVAGYLDQDPKRAMQRVDEVLAKVRAGSPGSTRLYSAQVLLARHTRDVLKDPAAAAQRLERLLLNLELPIKGIALCRLELGLSHMAAGDTARARTVLTRLGRGARFREAAGHAHYHLARLDLAQGNWDTARERLSAVALENAQADYANDALELAVLVAEEQARPNSDSTLLEAYSVCMREELLGDEDSLLQAYEGFVQSLEPITLRESPVAARARLELAELDFLAGRFARGLSLCAAVAVDQPDGPFAAKALFRQGDILFSIGDVDKARHVWERLLIQYPVTLEAEDARQLIRTLP
jgi:tetratricopeptide (TPR) repeat protein